MEYQEKINLLDNSSNQQTRCKTKNWVDINAESQGTQNKDNQIRITTSMLRSNLCDYSDAYILFKGTIIAEPATAAMTYNANTQVDDANDIDVVMPMYILIEYSDNYSKTPGILWQYQRDEPAINAGNGDIVDFSAANAATNQFKIKEIKQQVKQAAMAQKCGNNGTIKISK